MAKSIYVGMSGGVDSSVSAALLKQQGFAVTGVYMKNWTEDIAGVECPWKQDLADARAAAATIDIPFKVFDFQAQYKQQVVDAMVDEYRHGRTPNPDVMCNQEIKFKLFLQAALADGADFIATGHYAKVTDSKLYQATDTNKDQTYFLYRVTHSALAKTVFPLASLTKPEVRQIAADLGLPVADKPDSQGICFVGEVGLRDFLAQYIDPNPGPVVHCQTGEKLGHHEGAAFYTIGQRHGLGIGGGKPFYVTSKNIGTNTVFVTDNPIATELMTAEFDLHDAHWIAHPPKMGTQYLVRSRYRAPLIPCTVEPTGESYHVTMHGEDRAVTAGQSAVIYGSNGLVLGGGFIS
jgi:tRNA-uridine 2-sulfurtransferase